MAGDIFKEAEISDIKDNLSPIQSVDVSNLPQEFSRLFGRQEQAEQLANKARLEQSFRGAEQQRQDELSRINQGIGTNAQGAFGESLRESGDLTRAFGLTSKEVGSALQPEIQKRARIQDLRQQMTSEEINKISREFQQDEIRFKRAVQQYSTSLSNRLRDEQQQLRDKQDADYERSVDEISRRLIKRKTGGLFSKAIGSIAGGIIGTFAGGNTVAGASAGGAIAGGLSNLFSSRRNLPINF